MCGKAAKSGSQKRQVDYILTEKSIYANITPVDEPLVTASNLGAKNYF
jgi:hypothetical protein